MRVGNYSVLIPEGVERESGHVALTHGRQYTLRLMNHDHRRCDAEVTVDGKAVGGFRLAGHGQVTLERMPDDHGRLTFYSAGTADAAAAGEGGVAVPDKGLVQVKFVPERRREQPVHPTGIVRSMSLRARPTGAGDQSASGGFFGMTSPDQAKCYSGPQAEEKTSGGITGLSGHSDQRFVTVGAIDRDEYAAVTVSLRLVTAAACACGCRCGRCGPRELKAAPLSNPVPAPV